MGDEKKYTIQVKGKAYRFAPITPKDYERMILVQKLSTDQAKLIKALTRLLANSAGDDAWDELTDRYIDGELTLQELTTDVFSKLVKRQAADEKKAKGPKGLEVASSMLVSADDAE